MTLRTSPGPLVLDAGDFQLTHDGVTVGLKLSYFQSPVGDIASVVVAEKTGSGWVLKEELVGDFSVSVLESVGVNKWIGDMLLPKLNAWLSQRFGGQPEQVPDWVPHSVVDLDAAMKQLKVSIINNIPQVTQ